MRKKKRISADAEQPNLDISSLIDVCFLLLIYFIVTSIIAPSEKDLPITMPGGSHAETDIEPVLIGIRGDGTIILNPGAGEELLDSNPDDRKIPQVNERLAMMQAMAQAGGRELTVQVAAFEGVEQQRFVDVLNCLRGNNINTVTFTDFGED